MKRRHAISPHVTASLGRTARQERNAEIRDLVPQAASQLRPTQLFAYTTLVSLLPAAPGTWLAHPLAVHAAPPHDLGRRRGTQTSACRPTNKQTPNGKQREKGRPILTGSRMALAWEEMHEPIRTMAKKLKVPAFILGVFKPLRFAFKAVGPHRSLRPRQMPRMHAS